MNFSKQSNIRLLGASIIVILLLLPGVTIAEQVIKNVYKKMVAANEIEPPQTTVEQKDLGDPIITEAAATIEEQLNNDVSDIKIEGQTMYGNWLVYFDNNSQELIAYNLKSKEKRIISNTPNFKEQMVMYKKRLAWVEIGAIWVYDFEDGSIEKIAEKSEGWYMPDIYEDQLVYRTNNGIYLYNFKTKETETITEKADAWHSDVTIWKNIITWIDESTGYRNVFYYDLKKNIKVNITNNNAEKYYWGSFATKKFIVYTFVENDVKHFAKYDLKTGKTETIPGLKPEIVRIAVDKYDGGHINYTRMNDEIYTINLDSDEVKEYAPMDNKAVYGGVILGTNKDATAKFKVHRDN